MILVDAHYQTVELLNTFLCLLILVKYYYANKQEDSDWVVLLVTNFDAYFGTTAFGRKWLNILPENILERSETSYGICRYRMLILF